MSSTSTQFSPRVRLDGEGHITRADVSRSQTNTYEYMREFAAWVINDPESRASADLKARVNKFYTDLKTATRKDGDRCLLVPGELPTRQAYLVLVDAYNAEIDSNYETDMSTASQPPAAVVETNGQQVARPTTRTTRPARVVETSAPAPAPVAEPAVETAPASEPAPQPTRVVEHDDTTAPPWFAKFHEDLGPKLGLVDKHETTLYGEDGKSGLVDEFAVLRADVDELQSVIPRGADGKYTLESFRNTVRSRGVGFMIASIFGAFIGTFLLMALIVAFLGLIVGYGAIAAVSTWLWLITLVAIIAAFVAAIRIHRTNTASAVTREERI